MSDGDRLASVWITMRFRLAHLEIRGWMGPPDCFAKTDLSIIDVGRRGLSKTRGISEQILFSFFRDATEHGECGLVKERARAGSKSMVRSPDENILGALQVLGMLVAAATALVGLV